MIIDHHKKIQQGPKKLVSEKASDSSVGNIQRKVVRFFLTHAVHSDSLSPIGEESLLLLYRVSVKGGNFKMVRLWFLSPDSKFTDPRTNIREQMFQNPSYVFFIFCEVCFFLQGLRLWLLSTNQRYLDLQTNSWEHFFQTVTFVNSFVKSDFFHLPITNTPIHR